MLICCEVSIRFRGRGIKFVWRSPNDMIGYCKTWVEKAEDQRAKSHPAPGILVFKLRLTTNWTITTWKPGKYEHQKLWVELHVTNTCTHNDLKISKTCNACKCPCRVEDVFKEWPAADDQSSPSSSHFLSDFTSNYKSAEHLRTSNTRGQIRKDSCLVGPDLKQISWRFMEFPLFWHKNFKHLQGFGPFLTQGNPGLAIPSLLVPWWKMTISPSGVVTKNQGLWDIRIEINLSNDQLDIKMNYMYIGKLLEIIYATFTRMSYII